MPPYDAIRRTLRRATAIFGTALFVPRTLFGAYPSAERLSEKIVTDQGPGLTVIRGEAVRLLARPERGIRLSDGREIHADIVVLATGNLAPRTPGGPGSAGSTTHAGLRARSLGHPTRSTACSLTIRCSCSAPGSPRSISS